MTIKTLQGKFDFALQRFRLGGDEVSYFDLTGQFAEGYVSQRLKEFSAYYSNRMSDQEVEELIERMTGEKLLSDQKIWQIVVEKAVQVSQQLQEEVQTGWPTQPMPMVKGEVELYDPDQPEVLLFDDAIEVKEQKPTRDRGATPTETSPSGARVSTDVIMLEKADGGFHYLTAGIDEQGKEIVPLEDVVRAKIIQEYGATPDPLPLVALTDGAQAIRARLVAIFGLLIPLILDWYHLPRRSVN